MAAPAFVTDCVAEPAPQDTAATTATAAAAVIVSLGRGMTRLPGAIRGLTCGSIDTSFMEFLSRKLGRRWEIRTSDYDPDEELAATPQRSPTPQLRAFEALRLGASAGDFHTSAL
ncbi:hypothetical protein GCM10010411_93260 [Actinomadura fulvescens]|uniref:Uncharacterized protein n=1 Tax=Actinomadura fulvescens TaxID=46160 RepID=A0ABN3QYH7_9ACTN